MSPAFDLDPQVVALREVWAPQWAVWRARRDGDPPGMGSGEFVATRIDEAAGSDRTVMCPTARELDAELRRQRLVAGRGDGLPSGICGLG